MLIEYTGRQVVVTKAHRALGDEAVERIRKILGKTTKVCIILTAEKYRQCAEVTVKTRLQTMVGCAESNISMELALREALGRTETQAVKYKDKQRARKRLPKEEKHHEESELARSRRPGRSAAAIALKPDVAKSAVNGRGPSKPVLPVTVHSFPARVPVSEPHVVRSLDSVALRPMTLEEAVKEAEFRDREVFVFRDPKGSLMVLHRKRDGKMELIEAPS
ncbi:MAG TPA: HPF/RaiA family ribosome-associated protein [Acidisarcina sp.]